VAPGQPRRAVPPPRPAGWRGQPRRGRPRSRGKGGAATGAPKGQRLGAVRVVEVQPLHHGLWVAMGARCHLCGTARLGDFVERQKALAGALMGCTGGQLTQVLRCLVPPVIVNAQHDRGRYCSGSSPTLDREPAPENHASRSGRGLGVVRLRRRLQVRPPVADGGGPAIGASPEVWVPIEQAVLAGCRSTRPPGPIGKQLRSVQGARLR